MTPVDRNPSGIWIGILVYGILLLVLGVLALLAPVVASIAADIFLGWLFIISGIVGLVATLSSWRLHGGLWGVIGALLALAIGVLLVFRPIAGLLSLTLLLIAFFVLEGVAQIVLALSHRRGLLRSWGWMLASGIADLVLAGIIIAGWPMTAAWALGLIVGVNLITTGIAMITGGLAARHYV